MPVQVAEAEKWLRSPLDVVVKLHGTLTADYITCTSMLCKGRRPLSSVYSYMCIYPAEEGSVGPDVATGDHTIFDYFTGLLQSEENLAKV